jgi:hypothetical protein
MPVSRSLRNSEPARISGEARIPVTTNPEPGRVPGFWEREPEPDTPRHFQQKSLRRAELGGVR